MDGLQQQINNLNQKVEQLHQVVERLTGQLTIIASPTAITSSSFIPSDKSLQPLPRLSHREEKAAYARVIATQDTMELVGYGNTNGRSYSETSELVGNSSTNGHSYSETSELIGNSTSSNHPYLSQRTPDSPSNYYRSTMEHKDVLSEDIIPQPVLPDPFHEPRVASDIQIRRLMAQLTAAYNRIAILEEQLLASRRNS